MFSLFRFCISALPIAVLSTLTVHALAVRDTTSDVATTKGGVLVKNGKQTSCELGVIDSTAAFVAAPCLDFSGSSVNMTTTYEVYLDTGIDNNAAKYTVSSITVHPEYNATINLNPIAVLQFNKGSTETWSNPVAINRNDSWGDILFIRRGLTDMNSMEWETPLTVTNGYSDTAACSADTRIFEFNQNDLFCSNATTYPPYAYLTGCAIPYGSVDAYISGELYVAGIYVYTSIGDASYKCSLRNFQDSFYLLFADYVAFANKVLGRSISYYPNSNGILPQSDSGYTMQTPDYLYTYMTIKDGNFYVNQTDSSQGDSSSSLTNGSEGAPSPSNSPAQAQSDVNYVTADMDSGNDSIFDSASDSPKDNENSPRNEQGAPSNKTIAVSVVCSILGGLILTSLLLYVYKRWMRTRMNTLSDVMAQTNDHAVHVIDRSNVPFPQSLYIPTLSPHMPASLAGSEFRAGTPALSHINGYDKDTFEALEYYMPPAHDPSSPSTMSSISSFSSFSSSSWSINQDHRYS